MVCDIYREQPAVYFPVAIGMPSVPRSDFKHVTVMVERGTIYEEIRGLLEKYPTVFFYANT
jgi:hypothetical protein